MTQAQKPDIDNQFKAVIHELCSIAEGAIASSEILSLYDLPTEFLEIFLDIPGRRGGFCIISPSKLAVFFDEDPDLITIIGKSRNKDNSSQAKPIQLLKLSFSNVDGEYEYKDNTGGVLDPNDIVGLIIKWLQS